MKKRSYVAFFAVFAVFALLAFFGEQPRAQERVLLIVSGIEKQIYLPARVAEELGYFKEQGLKVELHSEQSGISAEDMLLAGAAQGVVGAYDHTIVLQAKGKSVQSVVQFSVAPGEVELVSTRMASQISSAADFKGRRLGVTGMGSSTSSLTLYLAAKHGLKPGDVSLVPVGSGSNFINAMLAGQIDAGMTTEPTASTLISKGDALVLVDLRTPEATRKALGGLYPFACLYLQTAWIDTHPVETQKLVNAFAKALRFISTRSASEIAAILPPQDLAGNRAMYIQSLAHGKSMFTPDGVMPPSGPATVLEILMASNREVKGKKIDLGRTFTTKFVNFAN